MKGTAIKAMMVRAPRMVMIHEIPFDGAVSCSVVFVFVIF